MGLFSNLNRLWSGADFWQGDENRRQREEFARQDREEEERRRREKTTAVFDRPLPVSTPQPSQLSVAPTVGYSPDEPLQVMSNPIAKTGFNNPILDVAQKTTPEQRLEIRKEDQTRKTLDDLVEANMEQARKDATQGEGFFGRNILNRKAIEERAKTLARTRAARQYQEKYGYVKDPTVLEFVGQTSNNAAAESERLRRSNEKLDNFAEGMFKVGEVASYVPVTGSVLNLGLAGNEKVNRLIGNEGDANLVEDTRLRLDAGMTKAEFDSLAPQATEDEFAQIETGINSMSEAEFQQFKFDIAQEIKRQTGEDIDDFTRQEFLDSFNMDTQQKIRNMQTLGLIVSPLDFLGAAGLARSGVTAAGKTAFKTALKSGTRYTAMKAAMGAAGKQALKEAAVPFVSGVALSAGAQTYLGGLENVDPISALKTGGIVAGTSLLFPSSTSLKKGGVDAIDDVARVTDDIARNTDNLDVAARKAISASDDVEVGLKKNALNAIDEADDLPGTRKVALDEEVPKIEVEAGIKTAEIATPAKTPTRIPDPSSPIALGRANDLTPGTTPIANFDNAPLEPAKLSRVSDNAIDASQLTQLPDQTSLDLGVDPQVETGKIAEVDAQGNPILKSDVQVARELADEGIVLERGGSTAASSEDAMESASRQATDKQVTTQEDARSLLDAVEEAQKAFNDVEAIRRGERGQRIKAGGSAYEAAGGGEQGYRAKVSQLKGKYAESGFQPVGVDEGVQVRLLDAVENSNLRDFEKVTAQRGLRKIWGAGEGKPVPSELQLIRKIFGKTGDQIVDQVEQALAEAPKGWRERLVDIAGIPRTAMTAFDLSMGLRQGSGVMFTNFPQWVKANKESVKYMFNSKYFDSAMDAIKNDDAFTLITDKMGVRLPGAIGEGAELMSSKDILENVPVYGKGIGGSNRAYTGGLTKLRMEVAKRYVDAMGGIDEAARLSDDALRDLGEVVNTFTGSGGKAGGITDKHITTLSSTLFAPRLWASRLNMLNPRFYQRLAPAARNRALANMASFMSAATATVGLIKYAGGDAVEVEMDPRSSDFLKIKVGNTRYDVFSGLQQNIVMFSRLATGEKKSSTTGELSTLGDGYGAPTRWDVGLDAIQNKFNPVLGYGARLMQSSDDPESDNPLDRKDRFGEDMNAGSEALKLGAPLAASGVYETYQDTGDLKKSLALNAPGMFGVGVQTYGDIPTKDQDRYSTDQTLKEQRKQLEEAGIPLTQQGIGDLADTGDYSNALLGARYRLAELEFSEDATEAQRASARRDIEDYTFGEKWGYIPSSEDAVMTRAENGNYDAAIAGWQMRLDRDVAEGNTPKSKIDDQQNRIDRYGIYKDYSVDPEMVTAYEKTNSDDGGIGVSLWRDMMESGDPALVDYAEKLYNLDQILVEAGIIKEPKYYWKKSGSGSRGGSSSKAPRFETNIGTLSSRGYSFNPQELRKASFTLPETSIPQIDPVPNYSRRPKEISVKRGRQL